MKSTSAAYIRTCVRANLTQGHTYDRCGCQRIVQHYKGTYIHSDLYLRLTWLVPRSVKVLCPSAGFAYAINRRNVCIIVVHARVHAMRTFCPTCSRLKHSDKCAQVQSILCILQRYGSFDFSVFSYLLFIKAVMWGCATVCNCNTQAEPTKFGRVLICYMLHMAAYILYKLEVI